MAHTFMSNVIIAHAFTISFIGDNKIIVCKIVTMKQEILIILIPAVSVISFQKKNT